MGETPQITTLPKRPQPSPADQARLLLELGREVTSSLDLQEVLDKSFAALRQLVRFGGGAIQLIEDDALVAAATDPPASPDAKTLRIPVGHGISGTIAATGEPAYIPDIWADPRVYPKGRSQGVSHGVRSYFGAPLILRGEPVGVVQIDSPDLDAFSPQARSLMLAFVPTIAAAVQNAMMFARERETLLRLREAELLKRSFLAVVSHELRTPLTSVAGFGHTLAHRASALDAATVAEIGERIWRASRRLERVMADLLDLSNIERGLLAVDLSPTDVEPILRESVREQTDEDHPMILTLEPGLPPALVDAVRLHQIVGNLLSNARKFSPHGSAITVEATLVASAVEVVVTDHGRGIPADKRDEIFQSFVQVEPVATRTAEGLGVGLYLVKQLCQRMRAAISVDSEPGSGARFTLRLPAAPARPAATS